MLSHAFMRNALLAGGAIALASGFVGYLAVLRSQVFAGDALSHVAFTGALAAAAIGINLQVGLFAATVAVAALLGVLGDRGAPDDVVIGSVFAWVLGLGVLFLSLFTANASAANGAAAVRVLFGSIFGLDGPQTVVAVLIAGAICGAVIAIGRPLIFSTLDADAARARRVPVRIVGFLFLLLLGLQAAESTQAVGALLLVGLLAAPAGAAQRLTARPFRGLLLSGGIALGAMWGGLAISYSIPSIPPSFAVIAIAIAAQLIASAKPRALAKGPHILGRLRKSAANGSQLG